MSEVAKPEEPGADESGESGSVECESHQYWWQADQADIGTAPGSLSGLPRLPEAATASLKRQAEPELINELLASGAVAASVTGAASVVKAKIDATTERLRIESDERTKALQAREETKRVRVQARTASPPPEPDQAEPTAP